MIDTTLQARRHGPQKTPAPWRSTPFALVSIRPISTISGIAWPAPAGRTIAGCGLEPRRAAELPRGSSPRIGAPVTTGACMKRRLNACPQFTDARSTGRPSTFCTCARRSRCPATRAGPQLAGLASLSFCSIMGPLTDPRAARGDPADAFDVVAPSIPGFGFSVPVRKPAGDMPSWRPRFRDAHGRLGYERYGAHGGDIGAGVAGS